MLHRLARAVPLALAAVLAVPAIGDEPQKDPAAPIARPEDQPAKGSPGAKAKPVAKDAPAAKGSAKPSAASKAGADPKTPDANPAGEPPAGAQKPPPCVEMKPCSID